MRRIEAGGLVAIVGAVVLIVSLFLDWYEPPFGEGPSLSGWTTFEVLDLILIGIAAAAIAAALPVAGGDEQQTLLPGGWLPWLGAGAVVLVGVSLINDPPAANGLSPDIGAWLALGGSVLIVAGGALNATQVSVVVSARSEARDAGPESTPGSATDQ